MQMDLTEAFAPNQAGGTSTNEKTTDYFDFVVSPPPHCTNTDGTVDDDSFLQQTDRATINYLSDTRIHDGFIKETNNNTLTALPPVSTITGSLGHINHHNHHRSTRNHECQLTNNDPITVDHTAQDCDYWVSDDSKEQTCNILLEDLNKYCWSSPTSSSNDQNPGLLIQRRDIPLSDSLQIHQRHCINDDRQNTDGAIYTLTVLKSEPNSMDGLECCKSPTGGVGSDGWSLRPNHLDLDAILNMESSVNISASGEATGTDNVVVSTDRDNDRPVCVIANGAAVNKYTAVMTSQYATEDQTVFGMTLKTEPGDNNNDWKLSDRNSVQNAVTVTESAAESLLRNALQGKLYSGAVTSTSLTSASTVRMLGEARVGVQENQDEEMHGCTDDLLLSQLDVDSAYRTSNYEKLKNIANEVVESYCNLEPVCNVSATTVMYTLDPTSGSLGTITLPADLSQVGTVTVVTTASPQQDAVHQDSRHADTQSQSINNQRQSTTSNQLQGNTSGNRAPGTKSPKKYVRKVNRTSASGTSSATNSSAIITSSSQITSGSGAIIGPPGNVQQRKERSLHYCSICSKGFKDKYSVNVHIRTHTGEKPFACSLCGKSFRQKAHLAKHYQTHVTQKPSVATAAQAVVATANSKSSNNNNTNGSNNSRATNSTNSNSTSSRSAPSPTMTDLQVPGVQQQQQICATNSPIVPAARNHSS